VNIQLSVMKILAAYPGRLAALRDLKHDLAILASSGKDWSELSRRLASAFPQLDIFTLGFVARYSFGWRLTHRGLIALKAMEAHARNVRATTPVLDDVATQEIENEVAAKHAVNDSCSVRSAGLSPPSQAPFTPAIRRSRFKLIDGGKS
jgi:hypothetical protein